MSIEIRGDDNVRKIAEKTARAVKHAVSLTAQDVHGNVIENSPVDHGRLAGSWQLKRLSALSYMISTAVEYAKYQNDGTGIYNSGRPITSKKPGKTITPKNGKALKFEVNGKTVFAKSVKQTRAPLRFSVGGNMVYAMSVKGVRGKKFVEKSVQQTEARASEFIEIALEREGLT